MKKLILFASAAAFVLAGCTKELVEESAVPSVSGKSTVIADYNGLDTRTHLGNDNKFYWDEGDAIGVFNKANEDNSNGYFVTSDGSSTFKGDLDFFEGKDYYGYYPYYKGAVIRGGILTVKIDAE